MRPIAAIAAIAVASVFALKSPIKTLYCVLRGLLFFGICLRFFIYRSHKMKREWHYFGLVACLCALGAVGGCEKGTQVKSSAAEDLPVSRVVMYQSGIGYVERNGVVSGSELVLHIRPDQINDILKSLTVIDRSNGRPVSISLPVDHAALDALSQIPSQIRDGGIRSLLEAFRGANVRIKTKKRSVSGRIVGVETQFKQVLADEIVPDSSTVTVLAGGNVLEVLPVADIRSVSLGDPSLAEGLARSLNISLNEGDWKQIELRISMDKSDRRELALSYLVAMPTWKPAYRLVLNDSDKGTLQGWAIVSNVTGSDWRAIDFSLVSGRPMSFAYDLYRPQFLSRPDLSSLGDQKAEAPVVVQSSYAKNAKASATASAKTRAYGQNQKRAAVMGAPAADMVISNMAMRALNDASDEGAGYGAYEPEAEADSVYAEESAAAAASAPITSDEMIRNFALRASQTQIGSFDEYKINAKLTIPDGNTALVNLIQSDVDARETRMFKPVSDMRGFNQFYKGWTQTESYQTIELNNRLGVALDSGPITIYRTGAVIGEGYLSRTERGAVAYVTFAKEGRLEVRVSDEAESSSDRLRSVENGNCVYDAEQKSTRTFEFSSQIPSQVTALLQIPKFEGWTPVDFPDAVTANDSAYVIAADIEPNASKPVALTMAYTRSVTRSLRPEQSMVCYNAIKKAYAENAFDDIQKPLFAQYLADAKQYETNETRLRSLRERQNEIRNDQTSLSSTLSGLEKIKSANAEKLRNQILTRQQSNEKKLLEITNEIYEIQVQNGDMRLRMQSYIKTLNYARKS